MSEQAPTRFKEALNNFDDNMAKHWEDNLQGEAGKTDFSADARKRLEEADEYATYMQKFSEDDRSAYDRGLDRLDAGEVEGREDPLVTEAYEMNETFDADKKAKEEAEKAAINAKFAADPKLRQMSNMAAEVAELRATKVSEDADKANRQLNRAQYLEDRLGELLAEYEASDNYDEKIADLIIEKSAEVPAKKEITDPALKNAAEVADFIRNNPEAAEKAGITAAAADVVKNIDTALSDKDEELLPLPSNDSDSSEEKLLDMPDNSDSNETLLDMPSNEPAAEESSESAEDEQPAKSWREKLKMKNVREKFAPRDTMHRVHAWFTAQRLGMQERWNELPKSERRAVKVAGVAIAAAGVGIGILAAVKGVHHGGGSDVTPGYQGSSTAAEHGHSLNATHDAYSHAAHTITPGEGFYKTFDDMGITDPAAQAKVLNNEPLMHHLQKLGIAYWDNGWKMNLGNGELSSDTLDMIKNAAQ